MTHRKLWAALAILAILPLAVLSMGQTATTTESTGFLRYLTSNSTSDSFTITAGRTTTAPSNMVTLGTVPGRRYRGAEFTFYGAGSATNTFDYKIWVVEKNQGTGTTGGPDDYSVQLFCSGTATLGATAGVGTKGPTSSDKIVDTLTVTPSAFGSAVVTAYGAVAPFVYSPGGGAEARLFVPDFGNASDFFIEYDRTGATSCNTMVKKGS